MLSINLSRILKLSKKPSKLALPEVQNITSAPSKCSIQQCTAKSDGTCPKCFQTKFCSKCWEKERVKHVPVCGKDVAYKFVEGERGSYHFEAVKEVPSGTRVLLEDVPFILPSLPVEFRSDQELPIDRVPLVCFACHLHFVPREVSAQCECCGIPKCSKFCAGQYHNETECKLISLKRKKDLHGVLSNTRQYAAFFLDVCVLRILSRFSDGETNPYVAERYRRFFLLQTRMRFQHFDSSRPDYYDGINYTLLIDSIDELHISLSYAQFDKDAVKNIFKTMIAFWEQFEIVPGIKSRILFTDRHFMNHRFCYPNVSRSVAYVEDKSQPVFYTYVLHRLMISERLLFDFSPHRFMALPLRREYLSQNGYDEMCPLPFCNICNTFMDSFGARRKPPFTESSGSISCFKCDKGIYVETINSYKASQWQCDKCKDVQPFSKIVSVNKTYHEKYMDEVFNKFGTVMLVDTLKFVKENEPHLHPKNGVILRAKYDYLMACREQDFYTFNRESCGLPLEWLCVKEMKQVGCFSDDDKFEIHNFPQTWRKQDHEVILNKAIFAHDCFDYLRGLCTLAEKLDMRGYTEISYLQVEAVINRLILMVKHYCQRNTDRRITAKLEESPVYPDEDLLLFTEELATIDIDPISKSDPLLLWSPKELECVRNCFKRSQNDLNVICRLVFSQMKITEDRFRNGINKMQA